MTGRSPTPTERFFRFMQERESIRLNREAGKPWPWTEDKILQQYKFTNVKREHDKTSRLLIQEFYKPNYDAPRAQILLNCAIARYFGTIEFMRAIGWQKTFNPEYLKARAAHRMGLDERVFTGAYIVPSGGNTGPKQNTIVDGFLTPMWKQREVLCHPWGKWERFVNTLMTIPGFGGSGFMAKEVTLDTRYTSFWKEQPLDRFTWTPIGPGSMRGAMRILGIDTQEKAHPAQTLETCRHLFHVRRQYLPKGFIELELHDVQFQLCEFDKYERVRLKQGRPRSTYTPPPQPPLQGRLL